MVEVEKDFMRTRNVDQTDKGDETSYRQDRLMITMMLMIRVLVMRILSARIRGITQDDDDDDDDDEYGDLRITSSHAHPSITSSHNDNYDYVPSISSAASSHLKD